VILIDANVLLYAYNADAPQQNVAARWLEGLLQSGQPVGLPWVTVWAFLRISTNSRIWTNPLSAKQAFAIVRTWLAQPGIILLLPGPRHLDLLQQLVTDFDTTGPLLQDAVLAALALENGATLASTDQDFRRFPSVTWVNPIREGNAGKPV
jgi:uncharacterized protein